VSTPTRARRKPKPAPPRPSRWQRLGGVGKGVVSALTGLAAAIAAVIAILNATGQESPTPASRQATVATVKITSAERMTLGAWASQDPDEDVSAWDPEARERPGVLVQYDATFRGLTGRRLAIRALALDRDNQRVGLSDATRVQPEAGEDIYPGTVWLEVPRKGGPFTAQVTVYRDEDARDPWARSEAFAFR
jgi:hypothetical protein